MDKIITKEDAFNRGLPKWPQCIIEGPKLNENEAIEIIRRTDRFFTYGCGNNRDFIRKADEIFKVPRYDHFKKEDGMCDFDKYHAARDNFDKNWQTVVTEYIENNWISCSWIGGPHGFCHPDGTIWYQNNIGKWPSVEDVYSDLQTLGKAFPNLEMTCTLMDAEECEYAEGVVSLYLKNGKIICKEPIRKNNNDIGSAPWEFSIDVRRENYFSLDQIKKWADKIYENI